MKSICKYPVLNSFGKSLYSNSENFLNKKLYPKLRLCSSTNSFNIFSIVLSKRSVKQMVRLYNFWVMQGLGTKIQCTLRGTYFVPYADTVKNCTESANNIIHFIIMTSLVSDTPFLGILFTDI